MPVEAFGPLLADNMVPLKELCNVRIGRTPRRDTPKYWGGSNVWLTIRELSGKKLMDSKEHITDAAVQEVMGDPVPTNTLLLSFKLSIGKMAISGCPLYTNEAIAALPLKNPEMLDRDYLAYAISVIIGAVETSHAVKGKLLNKKKLEDLRIPVPPIEKQHRIVDILKRADGIRCLRKQAQDTAHQLIPALFIEMFGDPATNPKGWNVVTFADVGTLDRGKSKHRPRNDPVLIGGPYPFIQTGDVANSQGVIRKYSATYSEVGLQQSRLWPTGTLCITIAANIADTATLGFDACFPDSVVGFIPNSVVTTEFVQYWLSFLKPVLEASAPQLAQKNINLRILRSLPIIVPPIELQNEFVARLENIQSIMVQQEAAQGSAELSFQSLLHRAFSGKI